MKTNFSKVEKALEEGLRKMAISKLCDLADIAAGIGYSKSLKKTDLEKIKLIKRVQLNLSRLSKKDKLIYKKLRLNQKELEEKLSNPQVLTDNEWKGVEVLEAETKKMLQELFPKTSDEAIIEEQKEQHLTRRFNVNRNWLPLQ